MLLRGQLKGKSIQNLQSKILLLSEEERLLIKEVVVDAIDVAIHDLLFAIQEAFDQKDGIDVIVDGKNVAAESGMLQGEPLGAEGWIEKFSQFPKQGDAEAF